MLYCVPKQNVIFLFNFKTKFSFHPVIVRKRSVTRAGVVYSMGGKGPGLIQMRGPLKKIVGRKFFSIFFCKQSIIYPLLLDRRNIFEGGQVETELFYNLLRKSSIFLSPLPGQPKHYRERGKGEEAEGFQSFLQGVHFLHDCK